MANKKENPNQDALTKTDLEIIQAIVLQSQIKASDAHLISNILSKIEIMIGKK